MTVAGCEARGDGGGLFTTSAVNFTNEVDAGISSFKENTASSGGAIMAYDEYARVVVSSNFQLSISNNTANLDGGGIGLAFGSSFQILDEGCASSCSTSVIGNGICDVQCMSRGCNWLVAFR